MRGVRDIEHHHAKMLLLGIVVRGVVGAVVKISGTVLRDRALAFKLRDQFQIAVVGVFGIATESFFRCGLAL
jgi:hypothetical protein